MSKKKEKTAKKPSKPQQELPEMKGPGIEALEIAEVDDAIGTYVDVRDRRMELTKKEVLAKEAVRLAMHRHEDKLSDGKGTLVYRCGDQICRCVQGTEKVSVKSAVTDESVD